VRCINSGHGDAPNAKDSQLEIPLAGDRENTRCPVDKAATTAPAGEQTVGCTMRVGAGNRRLATKRDSAGGPLPSFVRPQGFFDKITVPH
jgi:hypothetical protein